MPFETASHKDDRSKNVPMPVSTSSIDAPSHADATAAKVHPKETWKQSWDRLKSSSVALSSSSTSNTAFPPTMFLDAPYSNGILISVDDTKPSSAYFDSSTPYPRHLPILSVEEGYAWCHKHAAHVAVSRRFPLEAARLVGTITFHLQETVKDNSNNERPRSSSRHATTNAIGPFAYVTGGRIPILRKPPCAHTKNCKRITKKQAREEANDEECRRLPPCCSSHSNDIDVRAEEIYNFWSTVVQPSKPKMSGWNPDHGGLECPGNATNYVPLPALKEWITEKKVKQAPQQPRTKELYNGLCSIPVDIMKVLESLTDLSNPSYLYFIPLVIPYTVVDILDCNSSRSSSSSNGDDENYMNWRVVIGIYIHRLLPEVLTMQTLHIIMSALDPGSYRVTEPLHLPPILDKNAAVFQINPYPKVQWTPDCSNATDTIGTKKDDVIDLTSRNDEFFDLTATEGSTRDEPVISPFTVRGLLKLLESEGCDTFNWPLIADSVTSKLKLTLMLHQQHAICWMVQMESLGGFGINSILWEEREFWDGGKYYYSPALGQIRLSCPPKMNGGLLIDEMGLGKTVSAIGLILATLNELKEEAANHRPVSQVEYCDKMPVFTHATLIVVPPTLLLQWQHEISKAAGSSINVSVLSTDTGLFAPLYDIKRDCQVQIINSSDIVLTTYGALTHRNTAKRLSKVRWGRIVLDEMQEIRSSTTQISHNCNKLICNRRWMLSGTPLFEGIDDLRGELNFLRLEPFAAALEDGFFKFAVKNQWDSGHRHAIETLRILGLVALRRSKDMTIRLTNQPILDLKPLTVQFIPVSQTSSERAIYCWLEFLVATELKAIGFMDKEKEKKSRALCLRLLREFCITPMLLNGGLGVQSQLRLLHSLMVNQNRRAELENISQHLPKRQKVERVMSCDRAIRFLTQVRRFARTDEDFVTDVYFSTGGLTRRDIAHESIEARYIEATAKLKQAIKVRGEASKKRATLRWQLALELVTTGMAKNNYDSVAPKFFRLWKWRQLVVLAKKKIFYDNRREEQGCQNLALPYLFTRGWRPSPTFLRHDLYRNNPNFYWAHPISLQVDRIPTNITEEEVEEALYQASRMSPPTKQNHYKISQLVQKERLELEQNKNNGCEVEQGREEHEKVRNSFNALQLKLKESEKACRVAQFHDNEMKRPKVMKTKSQESEWTAIVQFNDEQDAKFVFMSASKSNGIPLRSNASLSHISAEIEAAEERVNQLEAENNVHPSKANYSALLDARKRLNLAQEGLRIVTDDKQDVRHAILSKPVGPYRSLLPRYSHDLINANLRSVANLCENIVLMDSSILEQTKVVERLKPALKRNIKQDVAQMSAFETLEALRTGSLEKTQCPICLGILGSEKSLASHEMPTLIAMISCGHLFCTDCLLHHCKEKLHNHQPTTCPNCRKQFSLKDDVMYIDHQLKDEEDLIAKERETAKQIVREASKMLESSNGQLDAKVWRALYLAFDVPMDVPDQANTLLPALPREILAHFRAATGMKAHCDRNETPASQSGRGAGFGSKIKALLADIPLNERSVVFSSSKECIKHLLEVFKGKGIPCRALFSGQSLEALKQTVSDWEGVRPFVPVLLVQAGAAASGLTLTVASKLFIMEPFLRYEEEQQAYARLHRFGQKCAVQVRCYFHPVSVESRLLAWRTRAQAGQRDEQACNVNATEIIIQNVENMVNEDSGTPSDSQVDIDIPEDSAQALFLLGLLDSENTAIAGTTANSEKYLLNEVDA